MKIKTVFTRGLSVTDEQFVNSPFLGFMSMKQIGILAIGILPSYQLAVSGMWYLAPPIIIPAIYMAFVKGKTFTPLSHIVNFFNFTMRNATNKTVTEQKAAAAERKPKQRKTITIPVINKKVTI